MTAEVEVAELAEQLTAGTCARQVVQHTQLTIHSDNGSPMIAKTVVILLAGVVGIALAWCRRDRLLGALLLAPVAAWLIKTMVY
jgi:preprotein translocase subunit SecD